MPHSVLKAIRQALTPSAFEPEIPSNYLEKYASARKLSYSSSNSTFFLRLRAIAQAPGGVGGGVSTGRPTGRPGRRPSARLPPSGFASWPG